VTYIEDVLVFGGMLAVGVGVWQYSPPAALITVGAVMVLAGLGLVFCGRGPAPATEAERGAGHEPPGV